MRPSKSAEQARALPQNRSEKGGFFIPAVPDVRLIRISVVSDAAEKFVAFARCIIEKGNRRSDALPHI
jgi:hypothetical protein